MVYLDRVELAWPFGLRFEPGSRVPLHCTSMGKLFLSQLPAPSERLCCAQLPLYRYTENTITDIGRLETELETISSTQVSIDNQEFLAGVVCVAVPVHGPKDSLSQRSPFLRRSHACRWNRDFNTFRCCGAPPNNWQPPSRQDKSQRKGTQVSLGYEDIAEILKIIDSSSCDEVVVETGDIKLVVRRNAPPASRAGC